METMMKQFGEIWAKMAAGQKALAIGLVVLVAVGVGAAAFVGSQPSWRLLRSELDAETAAKALARLDEAGIRWQVADEGRSILVDTRDFEKAQATAVKNRMFPGEGGNGYKALDGMSFGMTEEQQKLRIRVATEEEIARTLKQFEAVESAKVHLVSAERSFTRRDSSPAKASVILRMKPGRVLDPGAADAMARLVSNAAPGLLAANVIISDTQGNLLSRGGEEALGSGSFNQTRARERWLQEKAQTALDAALGAGRAVVRVDANIELDRIETRKEEVKPESKVVTKERISSSTSSTGKKASGSPSTSATITGASTGSGGGNATEDLESEYAYDRTITRKVVEAGAIRRLTIGVLLDANAEPKISSDTVREIVKGAVGFDDQRRDFIEVTAVPFAAKPEASPSAESVAPAAPDWSHVVDIVKWSVTAVVALGVLFFALKALKAAKATLAVATAEAAPKEERRPADPREEITRELDRDAQAVGRLLRNWLYEASRN